MERVRFVLSLADAQFALIQINSAAMWSTILRIQLALDVVQIAAGIVDAEGRGKYSTIAQDFIRKIRNMKSFGR